MLTILPKPAFNADTLPGAAHPHFLSEQHAHYAPALRAFVYRHSSDPFIRKFKRLIYCHFQLHSVLISSNFPFERTAQKRRSPSTPRCASKSTVLPACGGELRQPLFRLHRRWSVPILPVFNGHYITWRFNAPGLSIFH
jgi:hypothetical protein